MPPRTGTKCKVCSVEFSKYLCPRCSISYCSISCFREHKVKECVSDDLQPSAAIPIEPSPPESQGSRELTEVPDLRPLTTIKWPYIPDNPSYDDPLKRDDLKPLKLKDYESIATSPEIREILTTNLGLQSFLRKVDKLRGKEREATLEALLGVSLSPPPELTASPGDVDAIKDLAAAIEKCVRGAKHDKLGLDWN